MVAGTTPDGGLQGGVDDGPADDPERIEEQDLLPDDPQPDEITEEQDLLSDDPQPDASQPDEVTESQAPPAAVSATTDCDDLARLCKLLLGTVTPRLQLNPARADIIESFTSPILPASTTGHTHFTVTLVDLLGTRVTAANDRRGLIPVHAAARFRSLGRGIRGRVRGLMGGRMCRCLRR